MLGRLGEGALATAHAWPAMEQSADALASALRGSLEREPPSDDARRRALARAVARNVDLGRLAFARRTGEVAAAERRLELVLGSSTYRLAERLRRTWWALRRAAGRG